MPEHKYSARSGSDHLVQLVPHACVRLQLLSTQSDGSCSLTHKEALGRKSLEGSDILFSNYSFLHVGPESYYYYYLVTRS